jgi:WS/DGAT/MGAT family acyltransferase
MKHLSGLDATFLYLETPETPMHVGGLNLIDLPKGYKGDFYEDVKAHVASRMHLAPVFQRKLALMPFELADPVWVEDDDVDLDYHIRRIILPKPGTMEQLETYVGRLHSSLLDRSRPLWEFYVIEGLNTGQVGFYSKLHHAAVDGQAAVALAHAVLDVTPKPREVKPPPARSRRREYQLGVAELAQAALGNMVAQYVKLGLYLPKAAKTVAKLAIPRKGPDGKRGFAWAKNLSLGPRTPLNVSITNQRLFATASLPLSDVKKIARHFGVTLNDTVMALCSSALREYLAATSEKGIPKKPLVAAVPVSMREPGNKEANNQVAMMFCSLATNVGDPVERLRAINASTDAAKQSFGTLQEIIPTDFPIFGAPWLMSGLASLYGRSKIANKIPPLANVVISNVPGPQFPLYIAGGKIATYYPVSIIAHGLALNITVESYHGSLDFGFTACRRIMPDVRDIAKYLKDAHAELLSLVDATPEEELAPKPRRARVPRALKPAAKPVPKAPIAVKAPRRKVAKAQSTA